MEINEAIEKLAPEAKDEILKIIKSRRTASKVEAVKKKHLKSCFNCTRLSVKQNPNDLFQLLISCPHRNKFLIDHKEAECYKWKNKPKNIEWEKEDLENGEVSEETL